jgi:hypothetical protein
MSTWKYGLVSRRRRVPDDHKRGWITNKRQDEQKATNEKTFELSYTQESLANKPPTRERRSV